jgi:hypothetical protein
MILGSGSPSLRAQGPQQSPSPRLRASELRGSPEREKKASEITGLSRWGASRHEPHDSRMDVRPMRHKVCWFIIFKPRLCSQTAAGPLWSTSCRMPCLIASNPSGSHISRRAGAPHRPPTTRGARRGLSDQRSTRLPLPGIEIHLCCCIAMHTAPHAMPCTLGIGSHPPSNQ